MFTDAHCHPFDLFRVFPQAEEERRRLNVLIAASATDAEEFAYNEDLARKAPDKSADSAAGIRLCFAVHPQMPAVKKENGQQITEVELNRSVETLRNLAEAGRLAAVGECGFDLYNSVFRETEAVQDRLFAAHLETALAFELPVVIHTRRAMHKIFAAAKNLAKCRAVVFHSWPGTMEEGEALLRRGVNAYFSFGSNIVCNHRQAMRCCAMFPAERLLVETDAPFQVPKGQSFSHWADLPRIIEAASVLRREAGSGTDANDLETQIEANFRDVFL
jgi:TatD DNase family protein